MFPFVTPDTTATATTTTYHQPTTTISLHFKPSILVFFAASPQKIIDGKNQLIFVTDKIEEGRKFVSQSEKRVSKSYKAAVAM